MPTRKTSKLRQIYEQALVMQAAGRGLDDTLLRDELGLTVFGACCIRYMIEKGMYFPELEGFYHWKDAPFPAASKDGRIDLIEFLEDMPPFKGSHFVDGELSKQDKDRYVSLGIARRWLPDEFRRYIVEGFIRLERRVAQYRADFREAIARRDSGFMQMELKDRTDAEIRRMLNGSFTQEEIRMALRIRRGEV